MSLYYVHHNGAAWFVKEGGFFKSQGGLTSEWGKAWRPIKANSIEHARDLAARTCRLTSWVSWCPCHGWCL